MSGNPRDLRPEAPPSGASADFSGPTERAEAISTLFREHNRALVNFLLTRLPSEAEAREVAQEAYVRLLQLDRPVAVSFLRWYLFRIAKGIAVDRHRQRTARQRIDRLDVFDDLDISSPFCPETESTSLRRLRGDSSSAFHQDAGADAAAEMGL